MAIEPAKITLNVQSLGGPLTTISDCDPKWKFCEFLQNKGNLLDGSFASGQRTFNRSLFGTSKSTGSQVRFDYNGRMLILGDHFQDDSILRTTHFHTVGKLLINNAYSGGGSHDTACPICLDEIVGMGASDDSIRLSCTHGFHATCLQNWTERGQKNCCVCRGEINSHFANRIADQCNILRNREIAMERDSTIKIESCMGQGLENHDQQRFTLASNMLKSLAIIERTLDKAL